MFFDEKFDMTVVVEQTNVGSDFSIGVVGTSPEYVPNLDNYCGNSLKINFGYHLLKNLSFDRDYANKSPSGAVEINLSESR